MAQENAVSTTDDGPNAPFDVCVVCAMPEELQAFIDVAEEQYGARFKHAFSHKTNRQYRYATIKNNHGEPLRLHVSWQTSYGSVETSLHLRPVLEEFQPRFAAMTGICAGDRREVKLGDIIVAERAFLYDTGKYVLDAQGKEEHLRDTDTWRSHPDVLHMVRLFNGWKSGIQSWPRPISKLQQRDWLLEKLLVPQAARIDDIPRNNLDTYAPAWRKIIRELQTGESPYLTRERRLSDPAMVNDLFYGEEEFPYHDPDHSEVYIAPIASGNAVRADQPFADIQVPVRGTLAIDMEGAAFYRTVGEFADIRSLVVKGVSDYADSHKDDTYHSYAARVSAAYVLSFIQEFVNSDHMPGLRTATATARAENNGSKLPTAVSQPSTSAEKPSRPEAKDSSGAIRIFFSYVEKDKKFAEQLETHLAILKRQGLITSWHSRQIVIGQEKDKEIEEHFQQAQIILLLISPDFLASDERYYEMTRAVEAGKTRNAVVVPVHVRYTDTLDDTPVGKLLSLPRNGKPVYSWPDRDEVLTEIVKEIRAVVELMKKNG